MLETCVGVWTDRHFPADTLALQCRALQDSGVVDGVLIPDQLAGFIPRQLWTPENTPMAAVIGDPDSAMDAFMVAPYVHAAAPKLNLHLTTDSVRHGPAELIQSMLTLAHLTGGRANFQIGGGEAKQLAPFGHPTNQGMSRLRDLLRIYRAMLEHDGPFDYEGKRWTFNRAFLGGARQHLPTVWGLGGGPQLTDYVTSWADGLAVAIPNALTTPEAVHEAVTGIRRQVDAKGRDPASFRIGLWATVLMHSDPAAIERACHNPVMKFVSAATGRVESRQWEEEGLGLPFPPGWTYFKDLLPYATPDELVNAIVAATTEKHVRKAWITGTPGEVAEQIVPYLEAGIDWVMPIDYLPIVGDPADAPSSVSWMVELCSALKKSAGA
ncbi:LLM class flavin-dependent oxidoreductase [Mycobacterium sp. pUA109]|uniref:LLM class flavin-dependent oxidoreductase n=1 Tax=Mycobacterium sp. pUA109 TaxID=3238982 RepID=UPI00351B72CC